MEKDSGLYFAAEFAAGCFRVLMVFCLLLCAIQQFGWLGLGLAGGYLFYNWLTDALVAADEAEDGN